MRCAPISTSGPATCRAPRTISAERPSARRAFRSETISWARRWRPFGRQTRRAVDSLARRSLGDGRSAVRGRELRELDQFPELSKVFAHAVLEQLSRQQVDVGQRTEESLSRDLPFEVKPGLLARRLERIAISKWSRSRHALDGEEPVGDAIRDHDLVAHRSAR